MTPNKNLRFGGSSGPAISADLSLTPHTPRSMTGWRAISAAFSVLAATAALAATPEPLPVDEAFGVTASFVNQAVSIKFDVQPGHYLYADRFEVTQDGVPATELQRKLRSGGKPKQDPNFGLVKVYFVPVSVASRAPKYAKGEAAVSKPHTTLEVAFQGCSELAGICYPPTKRLLTVASGAKDVKPQDARAPSLKSLFSKQVSQ